MSQNTPRKFSEKIAILERKQNEEKETFHNVMRDVRAITSKTPNSPTIISPLAYPKTTTCLLNQQQQQDCQTNHGSSSIGPQQPNNNILQHPFAWNRAGGSLPNVYQMLQQQPQQQLNSQINNQISTPPIDYFQSQWNYQQISQNVGVTTPINQRQLASIQGEHQQQQHQQQNHRTRSPGSSFASLHYHPYMMQQQRPTTNCNKFNERILNLENNITIPNIHLQPPDNCWSK